jgi:cell division protein FtsL
MSNAAVTSYPVAQGATARALPGISPGHRPGIDQPRKSRTPLSLVRSVPRKRRAPFVVLCFGLLAIALMAVLVLNISVSSAQYQLVQLRSEQTTLTKQNQDLTQQVQNFGAPQNLAAKATELGMVPSLAKGQIDLSTLSVTGKAKPAVKDDAPGSVIAAPAVAGELTVVPPASAKDPAAERKPADTQAADAVPAPAAAAAEHAASAAAAKPAPAAAAPAAELHGGTVPAPAQKVPGQ